MSEIISEHELTPEKITDILTRDSKFRFRLHYHMKDSQVIEKNLLDFSFIPKFSIMEHSNDLSLSQFIKVKNINSNEIAVINKYIFNIQDKKVKIKSKRLISSCNNGSRSRVTIEFVNEDNLDENHRKTILEYLENRHKQENYLISKYISCMDSNVDTFSIPFEEFLFDVQDSVSCLEQMLNEEHQIDPVISSASREISSLKVCVEKQLKKIAEAIDKREKLERKIQDQAETVSRTASNVQKKLQESSKEERAKDSKNDVSFFFALLPLAVAGILSLFSN